MARNGRNSSEIAEMIGIPKSKVDVIMRGS